MKIAKLARVGVVVRELEPVMEQYAALMDITEWRVADFDQLRSHESRGRRVAGTFRTATGSIVVEAGALTQLGQPMAPVTFELVQPTGGESLFNEFLRGVGEGIAFLSVVLDPSAASTDVAAEMARLQVRLGASFTDADGRSRQFWDTRKLLGGYCLEVLAAMPEPVGEPRTVSGAAIRNGAAPIEVQRINHFGVVVPDLMDSIEAYREVFGMQEFSVKSWETQFGRLDNPYYRDRQVDHAYFTGQGFCEDFGFEIIQCTKGDSHYNREFFDLRGAGIHHFYSYITTSDDEWDATVASMKSMGAELCMGSDLRGGAAEYGYFDTFDKLGGFLIEAVVRRRPPEPQYLNPDWVVDFREPVSEGAR